MDADLIVDEHGIPRKKSDIDFVEEVIKIKNKEGIWPTIDKLLQRWLTSSPEEVEALKIEIADHKEMLTDKEFGQTEGGKKLERRFTLVFPLRLMQMIRTIFSEEELQFDSKFYREFVKHYPNFRVAERS
jgi:hypothetical protein